MAYDEQLATATHEAGHAVIMERLGQRVMEVTIDPNVTDKGDGRVTPDDGQYCVIDRVLTLVAGIASEHAFAMMDFEAQTHRHQTEWLKAIAMLEKDYDSLIRAGEWDTIRKTILDWNRKAANCDDQHAHALFIHPDRLTDEAIATEACLREDYARHGAEVSFHIVVQMFRDEPALQEAVCALRDRLLEKPTVDGDETRQVISKFFDPAPSSAWSEDPPS